MWACYYYVTGVSDLITDEESSDTVDGDCNRQREYLRAAERHLNASATVEHLDALQRTVDDGQVAVT